LPKENEKQINQFDVAPEYIAQHSIPLVLRKGEYHIRVGQIA